MLIDGQATGPRAGTRAGWVRESALALRVENVAGARTLAEGSERLGAAWEEGGGGEPGGRWWLEGGRLGQACFEATA